MQRMIHKDPPSRGRNGQHILEEPISDLKHIEVSNW